MVRLLLMVSAGYGTSATALMYWSKALKYLAVQITNNLSGVSTQLPQRKPSSVSNSYVAGHNLLPSSPP